MAYFHTTVLDNQIKALPTVSTASGSVASFDTDMTENLVKCVCEVASGASEINIAHYSVNLFDKSVATVGKYINANGVEITAAPKTHSKLIRIKPNTSYYMSGYGGSGYYAILAVDENMNTIPSWYGGASKTEPFVATTPNNARFAYLNFDTDQIDTVIFAESITPLEYQAFNGGSYSVPFGETLSGDGTFDVLSGILTRSDDTTKQLSANYIQTLNGLNNIYCDTGDTEVKYLLTVGKKIS